MKKDFHSHFSYDSDQDEVTTCEHMKISFTGCMRKIWSQMMVLYMILYMDVVKNSDVKFIMDYIGVII